MKLKLMLYAMKMKMKINVDVDDARGERDVQCRCCVDEVKNQIRQQLFGRKLFQELLGKAIALP